MLLQDLFSDLNLNASETTAQHSKYRENLPFFLNKQYSLATLYCKVEADQHPTHQI